MGLPQGPPSAERQIVVFLNLLRKFTSRSSLKLTIFKILNGPTLS